MTWIVYHSVRKVPSASIFPELLLNQDPFSPAIGVNSLRQSPCVNQVIQYCLDLSTTLFINLSSRTTVIHQLSH